MVLMNSEILHEIIYNAQLQDKAVLLHLNNILPPFKPYTIEPEHYYEIIDEKVLKIIRDEDKVAYISIDAICMVDVVLNKKDREKQFKEIFDEIAKKGEEKECFN